MKLFGLLLTLSLSTLAVADDDCAIGTDTEQALCQQVNAVRAANGVAPVSEDSHLDVMAEEYAQRLYNYYQQGGDLTHNIPGYEFIARMARGGVAHPCAENIASGQASVSEVTSDWQNSPGHFRNMTGSGYNKVGSGYYNGFWVQIFSR